MTRPRPHSALVLALICGLALVRPQTVAAQQEPAVLGGVQFLRGRAANQQVGETALIALAMLKAETPLSDPTLAACVTRIMKQFTGSGYVSQRRGGHDIYEAAVVGMMLANLDSPTHRASISQIAAFLVGRQNANGSWDYVARPFGDTSISQYALLGLWECDNAGVEIPPQVWDRAAAWFLSKQAAGGSWNYHRDEPQYVETLSMTAAGVGSLLICKRQLERYRQARRGANSLLTALGPENATTNYEISTSAAKIDEAVRRGMSWLVANFTTKDSLLIGSSIYYGLYGIERIAALADRQAIGKVDIVERGREFIRSSQRENGSWYTGSQSDEANTAWAIFYLTKSTAKSIKRVVVNRLGAGTLLGGRYLPKDLTTMTVAGGKIMSRPMSGAVEGMLAVLEDPRAQNADTAVSGILERYRREGPAALRPHKDRFRKLLTDRDPGMREVAAWALARTADLDVAPDLITALVDPEERVVVAASLGLRLLSRKIDGLGPPMPSTPEQRLEASRAWRAWYDSIRPLGTEAIGRDNGRDNGRDDGREPAAPRPAAGANSPARSPTP